MADTNCPSSPVGSASAPAGNEQLLSSPPSSFSAKERRQPSITPRKFRRFFTPRSRVSATPSDARRALRDLTARAINHSLSHPSSPLSSLPAGSDDDGSLLLPAHGPAKRRKTTHHTPGSSPLRPRALPLLDPHTPQPASSASRDVFLGSSALLSPIASSPVLQTDNPLSCMDDLEDDFSEPELPSIRHPIRRVTPLPQRGAAAQLFQRQLGTVPRAGYERLPRPVADWRAETADFCSSSDDFHVCSSHESPGGRCIPFCAASCNTNGLVAIGDEDGRIRLLDSTLSETDGFSTIHVSFAAHSNAVIDLTFSEDDSLLATASGDQTGKVIDMATQTPISILDHHTASLKQVRFQPGRGEGNVLATSGRDGSVKIWDLRCKGGPTQDFSPDRTSGLQYGLPRKASQGCVVNSIYDAHARTVRQSRQAMHASAAPDVVSRWEVPGRIGEVSVTAIQFLPAGKEHLILSACEADASIKLWDIRNVHTSRHKTTTPISITAPPESHSQWRPFGISSMSVSTDGARLYALCKDNTVYAYSTAHLVLGYAPELSSKGDPPKRRNGTAQSGLGPLYGFRHQNLHATSFYVKTAIRPARDGRSELLAVGSSDGCAILFPTDERYMHEQLSHANDTCTYEQTSTPMPIFSSLGRPQKQTGGGANAGSHNLEARRPRTLFRTNSVTSLNGRLVDNVPIIRNGTPLVRGHEKKEIGAVSWTSEGNLVTVGDDYVIRCWREDRGRASDYRTKGEGEGRRWASGWAEPGDDWDDEEWCEE